MNNKKFNSIDDNFVEYLNIFESNKQEIKDLPYFLIPIVTSLRFLLNEKLKLNKFVYRNNDKIYSNFINSSNNTINNTSNDIPKLYYYELEALIASSVAALTLTFLNKDNFMNDKTLSAFLMNKSNKESRPNYSINHLMNIERRSLELKNSLCFDDLRKNKTQFENSIQIYAEFINVLVFNSYILQTLKITNDFPEFSSFYSMYHYLWEESYYNMVDFFKGSKDKKISLIFNQLYSINSNTNKISENNYINNLEEVYSIMLNAILVN